MGLPVTDVLLVQLRILFFDCEGLFKSFDDPGPDILSLLKINFSSKWSRLGVMMYPNLATKDALIQYQYFFNIMLGKKQSPYFNILPQILPLDETLILSEPVRQIQDFGKTIDR